MRKTVARVLIVSTAMFGLTFVGSAPASAHHQGGHHCRWRTHLHSEEEYANHSAAWGKRHRHHAHQCHGPFGEYPPS